MCWIELGRACQEQIAPDFRLMTPGGMPVTRRQFRQRSHLVLMFLPDPSAPAAQRLLAGLAARGPRLAAAGAVVYAVAPIAGAPVLPVPVLPDPGKAVRRRYAALLPRPERPGDAEPFIVILDRYGALAHAARGALGRGEIADEILNWVQGLQHECPE